MTMANVLSDSRIAPVGEDLTREDVLMKPIGNFEGITRRDYPLASGVTPVKGQWVVLGADGKLHMPSGTSAPASFLVLSGSDRFDAKATGQATLAMAGQLEVMSSQYDHAVSYVVGDYLTAKLTSGLLTKAAASDVKHALVMGVGAGVLTYMTLSV